MRNIRPRGYEPKLHAKKRSTVRCVNCFGWWVPPGRSMLHRVFSIPRWTYMKHSSYRSLANYGTTGQN